MRVWAEQALKYQLHKGRHEWELRSGDIPEIGVHARLGLNPSALAFSGGRFLCDCSALVFPWPEER